MTMTYDKPADLIRNRIEAIRDGGTGNGDFLPGDGFDAPDAPRLDVYLVGLGYFIADSNRSGPGQFHTVTTACGMRIARNGSCVYMRDPDGPARFRMSHGPDGEVRLRRV